MILSVNHWLFYYHIKISNLTFEDGALNNTIL